MSTKKQTPKRGAAPREHKHPEDREEDFQRYCQDHYHGVYAGVFETHEEGAEYSDSEVTRISSNKWLVMRYPNGYEEEDEMDSRGTAKNSQTVTVEMLIKAEDIIEYHADLCDIWCHDNGECFCPDCNICCHVYICQCNNGELGFCDHIHKVHTYSQKQVNMLRPVGVKSSIKESLSTLGQLNNFGAQHNATSLAEGLNVLVIKYCTNMMKEATSRSKKFNKQKPKPGSAPRKHNHPESVYGDTSPMCFTYDPYDGMHKGAMKVHKEGSKYPDNNVIRISATEWIILSKPTGNNDDEEERGKNAAKPKSLLVEMLINAEDIARHEEEQCEIWDEDNGECYCPECEICCDVYICQCKNGKLGMCEHIHKVHTLSKEQNEIQRPANVKSSIKDSLSALSQLCIFGAGSASSLAELAADLNKLVEMQNPASVKSLILENLATLVQFCSLGTAPPASLADLAAGLDKLVGEHCKDVATDGN